MTTANLRSIMNLAWKFVKENNMSMSEALKAAWKNAKLYRAMCKSTATFTFRKVDGTLRHSTGTLSVQVIPTHSIPAGVHPHTKNSNRQTYFDMEKQEWRSYKRENLISIC